MNQSSEKKLTLEVLDEIMREVYEYDAALPERPGDNEPIVLTEEERAHFKKFGILTKHYRGGKMSLILSKERKEEVLRKLKK